MLRLILKSKGPRAKSSAKVLFERSRTDCKPLGFSVSKSFLRGAKRRRSVRLRVVPIFLRNSRVSETRARVKRTQPRLAFLAWGDFHARSGTDKLVNGKQHSVWFVPTGINGLPQNVLLNFRLEFPKNDLIIYHPSGISEIFCQMVSTQGFHVNTREDLASYAGVFRGARISKYELP